MSMTIDPYRFAVPGGDPNFGNVMALLHFDGSDGSTTFTDVTGRTWTPASSAQIDTAQSVFGGASMLCDGNTDKITAASSADFIFGESTDFTIEFRVRFNTVATRQIFIGSNGSKVYYFDFRRSGTAHLSVAHAGIDTSDVMINTTTMTTGVWYAIAVTRASGTYRLFVDGVQEDTAGTTPGDGDAGTTGTFEIGCCPTIGGNTLALNGWLDEFRFTMNVARYTSNYTPDASAFPDS